MKLKTAWFALGMLGPLALVFADAMSLPFALTIMFVSLADGTAYRVFRS